MEATNTCVSLLRSTDFKCVNALHVYFSCVPCVCVCVPQTSEEVISSHGLGVPELCEQTVMYYKSNPGAMQEQNMLKTPQPPFLAPTVNMFDMKTIKRIIRGRK